MIRPGVPKLLVIVADADAATAAFGLYASDFEGALVYYFLASTTSKGALEVFFKMLDQILLTYVSFAIIVPLFLSVTNYVN